MKRVLIICCLAMLITNCNKVGRKYYTNEVKYYTNEAIEQQHNIKTIVSFKRTSIKVLEIEGVGCIIYAATGYGYEGISQALTFVPGTKVIQDNNFYKIVKE